MHLTWVCTHTCISIYMCVCMLTHIQTNQNALCQGLRQSYLRAWTSWATLNSDKTHKNRKPKIGSRPPQRLWALQQAWRRSVKDDFLQILVGSFKFLCNQLQFISLSLNQGRGKPMSASGAIPMFAVWDLDHGNEFKVHAPHKFGFRILKDWSKARRGDEQRHLFVAAELMSYSPVNAINARTLINTW